MPLNLKTDNQPYLNQDSAIGQFVFAYKGKNKEKCDIYLMDNERNRYPLDEVSIISANFTQTSGEFVFPKPFRISDEGEIYETGAKLLIAFPFGRRHPVVVGCVNSLAANNSAAGNLRLTKDVSYLDREVKEESTDDYHYNHTRDKLGLRESMTGINKHTSITDGDYSMKAENANIEGVITAGLLGRKIEVGGNGNKVEETPKDYFANKADETNIYSKKICLGHSNDRGEKIEIDTEKKYLEPKMQKAVMGITLKVLLDKLIDLLTNAMYMGNGVMVKMSITDKTKIERKVKEKLPLILSEVVTLMCKGDQVE